MTATPDVARRQNDVSAAKSFAIRFVWMAIATAVLVGAIGWFTDLRQSAHAALLTCAAFAFLPFVIIMAGLGVIGLALMVSAIAMIFGGGVLTTGGGEFLIIAGISVIPGYYRFLARQRHPFFWAIPMGICIGGVGLWVFVSVFILPGEARTAEILVDAQARIEQEFEKRGGFPAPTEAGHLLLRSLGDEKAPEGAVLRDGFGRPVVYKKWGLWKVATWSLRSSGYDGQPGRDDLCRHGGTKLGRFAQAVSVRKDAGGKGISISIRLGSILELQCDESGKN